MSEAPVPWFAGGPCGHRYGPERHSHAVTFAAAAVTPNSAVVVADSQQVTFTPSGPHATSVVKTASGPAGVGVAAGITASAHGHITDHVAAALAGAGTSMDAAHQVAMGAAQVLGPHTHALVDLFGEGEVVWEAALAGTWSDTGPTMLLLTGYVRRGHIHVAFSSFRASAATARVVVLGARHPALVPLDVRHHESFADLTVTAQLTRMPAPTAPVDVPPMGAREELVERLESAVRSEHLAQRPTWWPPNLPVAAGPITSATH